MSIIATTASGDTCGASIEDNTSSDVNINDVLLHVFTESISPEEKKSLLKKDHFFSHQKNITPLLLYPLTRWFLDPGKSPINKSWMEDIRKFLLKKKCIEPNQPLLVQSMHKVLRNMMQELRYGASEGYCYGIVRMAMRAVFLGQVDAFNSRLERLAKEAHESGYNAQKILKNLEKDPLFYRECLAFFDGIRLLHLPHRYAALSSTPSRMQEYSLELYRLLKSAEEEDVVVVQAFSGVYENEELEKFFTQFEKIAVDKPLCLHMGIADHAVNAYYDQKDKRWYFVDANYLPIHTATDVVMLRKMVKTSQKMMEKKSSHLCRVTIEVLASVDEATAIREGVDRILHSEEWKSILRNANQICSQRLRDAASLGEEDVVSWLIDTKGVDLNENNAQEHNALSLAVYRGHVGVVAALLKAEGIDINQRNRGKTLLMLAVQKGHKEIVQMLLRAGINKDQQDHEGKTALTLAEKIGDEEILQALLDAEKIE